MKTVGNVLWLILCGVWTCALWAAAGAVLCVTIIGIPFGLQCFKIAWLSLWPFGRTVVRNPRDPGNVIGNVLWLLLAGVWIAAAFLLAGALLCVTLVGIPFGMQAFKLAGLALWPFGAQIVPTRQAGTLVLSGPGPTALASAAETSRIRPVPPPSALPSLPALTDEGV